MDKGRFVTLVINLLSTLFAFVLAPLLQAVEAGGVYTKNDTSQHTAMHGRMHGINSMRGHSSEDAVAIALPVVAYSRRSLEQV